jgi:hypothetical protein
MDFVNGFVVENNTFGNSSDSSQGGALSLGSHSTNVLAYENTVNGGLQPAYNSRTAATLLHLGPDLLPGSPSDSNSQHIQKTERERVSDVGPDERMQRHTGG